MMRHNQAEKRYCHDKHRRGSNGQEGQSQQSSAEQTLGGGINDILAELANLHVWPIDRDIADLERALLEELDSIEYEAGLDYLDRA